MKRAELIERINTYHAEFLGRSVPANFLATDQLYDTGLDSLSRIGFILYLQERFHVSIPTEYLSSKRIGTIGDIADLISESRAPRADPNT
jgi:acyl carrier protein